MEALRPYIQKIVGSLVAGLAAWLLGKFNLNLDSDTQIAISVVVVALVYGAVGTLTASKVNPTNAARASTAERETAVENAKEKRSNA